MTCVDLEALCMYPECDSEPKQVCCAGLGRCFCGDAVRQACGISNSSLRDARPSIVVQALHS